MVFLSFFKAWLIGVAVAAPIGPIGVLCIRRTLDKGFIGAISVGLGAALADSVYGVIAASGFTAISHFFIEQKYLIKLIGGVFLIYLAFKEISSRTVKELKIENGRKNMIFDLKVFLLTLTNPMTILTFIAIFSSLSNEVVKPGIALILVLGIFFGSMTWWLVLGSMICMLRGSLSQTWKNMIRYLSAFVLASFGLFAIII